MSCPAGGCSQIPTPGRPPAQGALGRGTRGLGTESDAGWEHTAQPAARCGRHRVAGDDPRHKEARAHQRSSRTSKGARLEGPRPATGRPGTKELPSFLLLTGELALTFRGRCWLFGLFGLFLCFEKAVEGGKGEDMSSLSFSGRTGPALRSRRAGAALGHAHQGDPLRPPRRSGLDCVLGSYSHSGKSPRPQWPTGTRVHCLGACGQKSHRRQQDRRPFGGPSGSIHFLVFPSLRRVLAFLGLWPPPSSKLVFLTWPPPALVFRLPLPLVRPPVVTLGPHRSFMI